MSLLSNLNTRIKALAARIAQQFKTQQTAIDSKVSKSGDTMTGALHLKSSVSAKIFMHHTELDATANPSNELNIQLWYNDKNSVGLGTLQYIKYENGGTAFLCTHRTGSTDNWKSFGQFLNADGSITFNTSATRLNFTGNGTAIWIA